MSEANSIVLISDGWTEQVSNNEYLGLAVNIINDQFDKSTLVIGMDQLKEGHSAIQIQESIQEMINKFKFDKNKISGLFDYF